jgi:hypothetical protein
VILSWNQRSSNTQRRRGASTKYRSAAPSEGDVSKRPIFSGVSVRQPAVELFIPLELEREHSHEPYKVQLLPRCYYCTRTLARTIAPDVRPPPRSSSRRIARRRFNAITPTKTTCRRPSAPPRRARQWQKYHAMPLMDLIRCVLTRNPPPLPPPPPAPGVPAP